MQEKCRACLSTSSLFDWNTILAGKMSYADLFFHITSLNKHNFENMQLLCSGCGLEIRQIHDFIQKATKAEQTLGQEDCKKYIENNQQLKGESNTEKPATELQNLIVFPQTTQFKDEEIQRQRETQTIKKEIDLGYSHYETQTMESIEGYDFSNESHLRTIKEEKDADSLHEEKYIVASIEDYDILKESETHIVKEEYILGQQFEIVDLIPQDNNISEDNSFEDNFLKGTEAKIRNNESSVVITSFACKYCGNRFKSVRSRKHHMAVCKERLPHNVRRSLKMTDCNRINFSSSTSSTSMCDDIPYCTGSLKDDSDSNVSNEEILSTVSATAFHPIFKSLCDNVTPASERSNTLNSQQLNIFPGPSIVNTSFNKKIKRLKLPEKCKQNVNKRKSERQCESHTMRKKVKPKREMKSPCSEICRLKCSKKFSDDERKQLFTSFWDIANTKKQRQFIFNSMKSIEPAYRYVRVGGTRGPRQNNNAFFFKQGDNVVRVCKLFFKNTLDISDRPIRTVLKRREKFANQTLGSQS